MPVTTEGLRAGLNPLFSLALVWHLPLEPRCDLKCVMGGPEGASLFLVYL